MNRIETTLTILAASALLTGTAGAADATMEALNARLTQLESKLSALELSMSDRGSSYSYNDDATREATKNGKKDATGSGQTYVIKDGDTLGLIAEKHGVERKDLLEANRLSEGQPIYIGETLIIPGGITAPEASPSGTGAVADAGKPAPVKQ